MSKCYDELHFLIPDTDNSAPNQFDIDIFNFSILNNLILRDFVNKHMVFTFALYHSVRIMMFLGNQNKHIPSLRIKQNSKFLFSSNNL